MRLAIWWNLLLEPSDRLGFELLALVPVIFAPTLVAMIFPEFRPYVLAFWRIALLVVAIHYVLSWRRK